MTTAYCEECKKFLQGVPALPNVSLCERHLREATEKDPEAVKSFQHNTLDGVRPFTLQHEAARIQRVENALHGLDMATALRVLEFVRSRVVGDNGFR